MGVEMSGLVAAAVGGWLVVSGLLAVVVGTVMEVSDRVERRMRAAPTPAARASRGPAHYALGLDVSVPAGAPVDGVLTG